MKILMISEHASPLACLGGADGGGQNVYVHCLSEALARRGISIDICTRRDDTNLPEIVALAPRVRVIHVPAGPPEFVRKEDLLQFMPAFADWCSAWLNRERYDLSHANFFMSGYVSGELKKRRQLPFVVTFHALGKVRRIHQAQADGFPDQRFAIEEQIVRDSDAIIAECPQDKADLESLYQGDPRKIATVACGVDTSMFFAEPRSKARARLGLSGKENILLHLGRMVPRKGVDTVIEALALLKKSGDPSKLIVVGGESEVPDPVICPEIKRLDDLASALGVKNRVIFMGRRPANVLRWYYSAADLFVTTPWYEPFGITPLESMACGTPVIGSRVGGIKSTVVDRETGFLVKPKDPNDLAAAVETLLYSPDLRKTFSQRGLERVRRYYTWDQIAAQMANVYASVLRRRQPAKSSRVVYLPPIARVLEHDSQAAEKSQAGAGNADKWFRRAAGTDRTI